MKLTSMSLLRWVASLQGATTHSQSDRIVTARYSAFLFITQFIIFSLLGVIVQIGGSGFDQFLARNRLTGPCPLVVQSRKSSLKSRATLVKKRS